MSRLTPRAVRAVIVVWALLSLVLALLPSGVGGVPRVLNAVVFMTLGPGISLMVLLRSRPFLSDWSTTVAGVVSVATSLTVLVLSSQLLLLLGHWSVAGIAGIVTLATVAIVALSSAKIGSV